MAEVVEKAGAQAGPEFEAVLATSRIWRNGEPVTLDDPVGDGDELALLPPVSGGTAATMNRADLTPLASAVAAIVIIVMNLRAGDAWWAAALVGVVGLWVVDISREMEARGRAFPAMAVLVATVAGAVVPHALDVVGLAVAMALSVVIVLAWGVGIEGYRSVDTVAPGVLVAFLATTAVGSLVLTRSTAVPDPQAIDVFLWVVAVAVVLGAGVDRLTQLPYLDPYTVTAIAAILTAVGVAYFGDLDVAGYLLVGLGLAVTLVAGRGLGSLLRTGTVSLTDRAPGMLRGLDGAILAAAIYFPLVKMVL